MPRHRYWNDDRGEWVDRYTCRYCFDDATDDGPRGNGTDGVYLLRVDGRIAVFCSAACRTMWDSNTDIDTHGAIVADDVDPDDAP